MTDSEDTNGFNIIYVILFQSRYPKENPLFRPLSIIYIFVSKIMNTATREWTNNRKNALWWHVANKTTL